MRGRVGFRFQVPDAKRPCIIRLMCCELSKSERPDQLLIATDQLWRVGGFRCSVAREFAPPARGPIRIVQDGFGEIS